jgi:hypothetical protein
MKKRGKKIRKKHVFFSYFPYFLPDPFYYIKTVFLGIPMVSLSSSVSSYLTKASLTKIKLKFYDDKNTN